MYRKYFFWSLYSRSKRLFVALPFTIKGLILLAICSWSFYSLGLPKEDLVISILCSSVTALVLLLSIFTLAIGMKLRSKISFSLGFSESTTYSKTKNWLSLLAENSSIPAFYNLKVICNFTPNETVTSELIISGQSIESRHCAINTSFPHRGFWQLNNFKIEFSDALGLTQKVWKQAHKKTIRVLPLPVEIQALSLRASSAKPGDEYNLPKERSGDPFDIKQYEPSDGVRRILWKTYARTKQLFVRRPELAIIPEGEVAIYLIAAKDDDHVASACMQQIKNLFENDLLVIFGTDLKDELGIENSGIEKSYDKIEDLMLKATNDDYAGTGKGLSKFLSGLNTKGHNLGQVNVFAADNFMFIDELSLQASSAGIKVNLILVENPAGASPKLTSKRFNLSDFELNYIKPILHTHV